MDSLSDISPLQYKTRISSGKDWNEIVSVVRDLPPLPHVASRALALVEDPNVNANQLTSILQKDPALAARVLKIANSAMFAVQRKITTLSQAIIIIGFKTLKGVILAATLRQINRKSGELERLTWENSMSSAIIAHTICHHLRKPYADELFLCSLLHDLGKLVIAAQIPKEYDRIVQQTKQGKRFVEIEQEILGFSHPLIGALVAKKWNFSDAICQVLLHHHDPLSFPITEDIYLRTAIVQLSNSIAHVLGYGNVEGYADYSQDLPEQFKLVGIKEEDQERLLERIKITVAEQAGAFLQ